MRVKLILIVGIIIFTSLIYQKRFLYGFLSNFFSSVDNTIITFKQLLEPLN